LVPVDGGDLTAMSGTGQQPLHLAALAGDTAMLMWLEQQEGVVRRPTESTPILSLCSCPLS
jgi:hypothetical protein